MLKHPMIAVKDAALMLGCDERWVRERLNQGQLKGEKRKIGAKDKWFVYKGAIEQALAEARGVPTYSRATADVSVDDGGDFESDISFEPREKKTIQVDFSQKQTSTEDTDPFSAEQQKVKEFADLLLKPLVEKVESQTRLLVEQERTIREQEIKLRLLPDLQKREEEERKALELKEVEAEALRKQIAAIQEEKQKVELDAQETQFLRKQVEELENEKKSAVEALSELEALKAKVADLQKPFWQKFFRK